MTDTPTPFAAVLPGNVAAGELIESAWGNAVVAELQQHENEFLLRRGFYTATTIELAIPVSPAELTIGTFTLTGIYKPGTFLVSVTGQTWTNQDFLVRVYSNATLMVSTRITGNSDYCPFTVETAVGAAVGDTIASSITALSTAGGLRAAANMHAKWAY